MPCADDYPQIAKELRALLEDETDEVAALSSAAAVLFHRLDGVSFCGFYRAVEPDTLVIGPYQGPVGCLRIPLGKGVCGTAAAERRIQLVPDVHAFPGHIACDATAQSELVIPVFTGSGRFLGVLDLDSRNPDHFDEVDAGELDSLLRLAFRDLE